MRAPSGLKAALLTAPVWPCSMAASRPSRRPTAAPSCRRRPIRCGVPSGLKAALKTAPVWPCSTAVSLPVAASHSRTVLSWEADAMRAPSGLKATLLTAAGVALQHGSLLARRDVPQPHRLVVGGRQMRLPSGLKAR